MNRDGANIIFEFLKPCSLAEPIGTAPYILTVIFCRQKNFQTKERIFSQQHCMLNKCEKWQSRTKYAIIRR